MLRKGRREHVGAANIFEFYISDLRYKRLLSFVPNSIPQVMKMVLLINLTCYYSKETLWNLRMSVSS